MHRRLVYRLLLVTGLLGGTLLVGTLGFAFLEHDSWFDALYVTATTITTVGHGSAGALDLRGRVFELFLILFGVMAMLLAVGAMTQTIFELELEDFFGQRRRRRMIEKLEDHFIVCGYGRVGRNASLELKAAGATFVVVDGRPERTQRATAAGMLAMVADATQDQSLRDAGLMKARGLISALPGDAENLFIILSAKALNPGLMIVTRASEEEAGEKLRRAGADVVLTPYSVAGRQLADALLRPKVMEFLDFARGSGVGPTIIMGQVSIGPHTGAAGRTVGQVRAMCGAGVIVLALRARDGKTMFSPPEGAPLAEGDFLIVMGERPLLQRMETMLTS